MVGPTAVGKTALAIRLANYFQTVIVSADSRQVYQQMPIGTALPTAEERAQAQHFLVDFLAPDQAISAGQYAEEALKLLQTLFKTHPVVLLVGGSGLYVQAVCEGLDQFPEVDKGIREELNRQLAQTGLSPLLQQLQQLDPAFFYIVDKANPRRVIRALEVCLSSGKPFSSFHKQTSPPQFFQTLKIGLHLPREALYDRINQRVQLMMQQGLAQEVEALKPYSDCQALQTVGYREFFPYWEGAYDETTLVALIQQHTRQFAKRQLTWFRKDTTIQWFEPQAEAAIIALIEETLKQKV